MRSVKVTYFMIPRDALLEVYANFKNYKESELLMFQFD